MNEYEFIKYVPTPGEKHLGIASISYKGKIVLRYKVVPTKDGQSFYLAAAAYKIGETYQPSFVLDSNIEKEEIESIIKSKIKNIIESDLCMTNKSECNLREMPF